MRVLSPLQLSAIDESPVGSLSVFINKALQMTKELLRLAKHDIPKQNNTVSMQRLFPTLKALGPSPLLIPLQEALTVSLPSDANVKGKEHNPFPVCTVRFKGAFQSSASILRPPSD